ncbi:MAG TPA: type II toxin-antitoxin system VapC family toxin [Terracidiphilus sp.]|nr:type II toxin-antitoxin system VapC family toxin [Terracidiphilus sp.]
MRFLLDTHVAMWAYFDRKRLSAQARSVLEDRHNSLVFSTANLWEIAIKRALGKKGFQFDPRVLRRTMLDDGFEELPVLGQHAVEADTLPPIHKDPFDRILIAQAMVEGITLLTADPVIAQYPGPIRKV